MTAPLSYLENNVDEVAQALLNREVKGALVDAYVAAARSDLFDRSGIVAKKTIKYHAAYGLVLSGDLKHLHQEVADFVSVHSQQIAKLVEERTKRIKVSAT